MRLLLTGAGGLIGRQVATLAAARGMDLVATGRSRPDSLSSQASFHAADLTDPSAAAALLRAVAPTHVIHAAWETRPPTYWDDPANLDWVAATALMAKAFAEAGGKRFVQVGSCTEYAWDHGLCAEEVTPDRPASRYGKAKLAAFRAVEAAGHGTFDAIEARVFFVYGPGERPERFVPLICRAHLHHEVPALGSGRPRRDLLHAEDVARALLALASVEGLTGVVNVAAGEATPLADVATKLAAIAGARETGLGRSADRPNDPDLLVGTCERLRGTGWVPRIGLDEGLSATFDWWRRRERAG